MWLVNYFRECKAWREVKKVYKSNRKEFEKVGLKCDYFGRLYKVINRDPTIHLGTPEDSELLSQELKELSEFLIKMNLIDILAYELIPLEDGDDKSFENAYLITLTPAWDLNRQYVSFGSTSCLLLVTASLLTGIYFLISNVLC